MAEDFVIRIRPEIDRSDLNRFYQEQDAQSSRSAAAGPVSGATYVPQLPMQATTTQSMPMQGDMQSIVQQQARLAALQEQQMQVQSRVLSQPGPNSQQFQQEALRKLQSQIQNFDILPKNKQNEIARAFNDAFERKILEFSRALANVRPQNLTTSFNQLANRELAALGIQGRATATTPAAMAYQSQFRVDPRIRQANERQIRAVEAQAKLAEDGVRSQQVGLRTTGNSGSRPANIDRRIKDAHEREARAIEAQARAVEESSRKYVRGLQGNAGGQVPREEQYYGGRARRNNPPRRPAYEGPAGYIEDIEPEREPTSPWYGNPRRNSATGLTPEDLARVEREEKARKKREVEEYEKRRRALSARQGRTPPPRIQPNSGGFIDKYTPIIGDNPRYEDRGLTPSDLRRIEEEERRRRDRADAEYRERLRKAERDRQRRRAAEERKQRENRSLPGNSGGYIDRYTPILEDNSRYQDKGLTPSDLRRLEEQERVRKQKEYADYVQRVRNADRDAKNRREAEARRRREKEKREREQGLQGNAGGYTAPPESFGNRYPNPPYIPGGQGESFADRLERQAQEREAQERASAASRRVVRPFAPAPAPAPVPQVVPVTASWRTRTGAPFNTPGDFMNRPYIEAPRTTDSRYVRRNQVEPVVSQSFMNAVGFRGTNTEQGAYDDRILRAEADRIRRQQQIAARQFAASERQVSSASREVAFRNNLIKLIGADEIGDPRFDSQRQPLEYQNPAMSRLGSGFQSTAYTFNAGSGKDLVYRRRRQDMFGNSGGGDGYADNRERTSALLLAQTLPAYARKHMERLAAVLPGPYGSALSPVPVTYRATGQSLEDYNSRSFPSSPTVDRKHLTDLQRTLSAMYQAGLGGDTGAHNLLYDKKKGFTVIDYWKQGQQTKTDADASAKREVDRMVQSLALNLVGNPGGFTGRGLQGNAGGLTGAIPVGWRAGLSSPNFAPGAQGPRLRPASVQAIVDNFARQVGLPTGSWNPSVSSGEIADRMIPQADPFASLRQLARMPRPAALDMQPSFPSFPVVDLFGRTLNPGMSAGNSALSPEWWNQSKPLSKGDLIAKIDELMGRVEAGPTSSDQARFVTPNTGILSKVKEFLGTAARSVMGREKLTSGGVRAWKTEESARFGHDQYGYKREGENTSMMERLWGYLYGGQLQATNEFPKFDERLMSSVGRVIGPEALINRSRNARGAAANPEPDSSIFSKLGEGMQSVAYGFKNPLNPSEDLVYRRVKPTGNFAEQMGSMLGGPWADARQRTAALVRAQGIPGIEQLVGVLPGPRGMVESPIPITKRAPGKTVSAQLRAGLMTDVTNEQLDSLYQTFYQMALKGIGGDNHTGNMMYDSEAGFTKLDFWPQEEAYSEEDARDTATMNMEEFMMDMSMDGWKGPKGPNGLAFSQLGTDALGAGVPIGGGGFGSVSFTAPGPPNNGRRWTRKNKGWKDSSLIRRSIVGLLRRMTGLSGAASRLAAGGYAGTRGGSTGAPNSITGGSRRMSWWERALGSLGSDRFGSQASRRTAMSGMGITDGRQYMGDFGTSLPRSFSEPADSGGLGAMFSSGRQFDARQTPGGGLQGNSGGFVSQESSDSSLYGELLAFIGDEELKKNIDEAGNRGVRPRFHKEGPRNKDSSPVFRLLGSGATGAGYGFKLPSSGEEFVYRRVRENPLAFGSGPNWNGTDPWGSARVRTEALRKGQGIAGLEQLATVLPGPRGIQETPVPITRLVPGEILSNLVTGDGGRIKNTINSISDIPIDQWKQLYKTLVSMNAAGIGGDSGPQNIMYDPKAGFTVIDYLDKKLAVQDLINTNPNPEVVAKDEFSKLVQSVATGNVKRGSIVSKPSASIQKFIDSIVSTRSSRKSFSSRPRTSSSTTKPRSSSLQGNSGGYIWSTLGSYGLGDVGGIPQAVGRGEDKEDIISDLLSSMGFRSKMEARNWWRRERGGAGIEVPPLDRLARDKAVYLDDKKEEMYMDDGYAEPTASSVRLANEDFNLGLNDSQRRNILSRFDDAPYGRDKLITYNLTGRSAFQQDSFMKFNVSEDDPSGLGVPEVATVAYSTLRSRDRGKNRGIAMYLDAFRQLYKEGVRYVSNDSGSVSADATRVWEKFVELGLGDLGVEGEGSESSGFSGRQYIIDLERLKDPDVAEKLQKYEEPAKYIEGERKKAERFRKLVDQRLKKLLESSPIDLKNISLEDLKSPGYGLANFTTEEMAGSVSARDKAFGRKPGATARDYARYRNTRTGSNGYNIYGVPWGRKIDEFEANISVEADDAAFRLYESILGKKLDEFRARRIEIEKELLGLSRKGQRNFRGDRGSRRQQKGASGFRNTSARPGPGPNRGSAIRARSDASFSIAAREFGLSNNPATRAELTASNRPRSDRTEEIANWFTNQLDKLQGGGLQGNSGGFVGSAGTGAWGPPGQSQDDPLTPDQRTAANYLWNEFDGSVNALTAQYNTPGLNKFNKDSFISFGQDSERKDIAAVNYSSLEPSLRGKGYGLAMYIDALKRARENGIKYISNDMTYLSPYSANVWKTLENLGLATLVRQGSDNDGTSIAGRQYLIDTARFDDPQIAKNINSKLNPKALEWISSTNKKRAKFDQLVAQKVRRLLKNNLANYGNDKLSKLRAYNELEGKLDPDTGLNPVSLSQLFGRRTSAYSRSATDPTFDDGSLEYQSDMAAVKLAERLIIQMKNTASRGSGIPREFNMYSGYRRLRPSSGLQGSAGGFISDMARRPPPMRAGANDRNQVPTRTLPAASASDGFFPYAPVLGGKEPDDLNPSVTTGLPFSWMPPGRSWTREENLPLINTPGVGILGGDFAEKLFGRKRGGSIQERLDNQFQRSAARRAIETQLKVATQAKNFEFNSFTPELTPYFAQKASSTYKTLFSSFPEILSAIEFVGTGNKTGRRFNLRPDQISGNRGSIGSAMINTMLPGEVKYQMGGNIQLNEDMFTMADRSGIGRGPYKNDPTWGPIYEHLVKGPVGVMSHEFGHGIDFKARTQPGYVTELQKYLQDYFKTTNYNEIQENTRLQLGDYPSSAFNSPGGNLSSFLAETVAQSFGQAFSADPRLLKRLDVDPQFARGIANIATRNATVGNGVAGRELTDKDFDSIRKRLTTVGSPARLRKGLNGEMVFNQDGRTLANLRRQNNRSISTRVPRAMLAGNAGGFAGYSQSMPGSSADISGLSDEELGIISRFHSKWIQNGRVAGIRKSFRNIWTNGNEPQDESSRGVNTSIIGSLLQEQPSSTTYRGVLLTQEQIDEIMKTGTYTTGKDYQGAPDTTSGNIDVASSFAFNEFGTAGLTGNEGKIPVMLRMTGPNLPLTAATQAYEAKTKRTWWQKFAGMDKYVGADERLVAGTYNVTDSSMQPLSPGIRERILNNPWSENRDAVTNGIRTIDLQADMSSPIYKKRFNIGDMIKKLLNFGIEPPTVAQFDEDRANSQVTRSKVTIEEARNLVKEKDKEDALIGPGSLRDASIFDLIKSGLFGKKEAVQIREAADEQEIARRRELEKLFGDDPFAPSSVGRGSAPTPLSSEELNALFGDAGGVVNSGVPVDLYSQTQSKLPLIELPGIGVPGKTFGEKLRPQKTQGATIAERLETQLRRSRARRKIEQQLVDVAGPGNFKFRSGTAIGPMLPDSGAGLAMSRASKILLSRFPEMLSTIGMIGTPDALNPVYNASSITEGVAIDPTLWTQDQIDEQITRGNLVLGSDGQYRVPSETAGGSAYAGGTFGGVNYPGAIAINPESFDISRINKERQSEYASLLGGGPRNNATVSPASYLTHEFGHTVDYKARTSKGYTDRIRKYLEDAAKARGIVSANGISADRMVVEQNLGQYASSQQDPDTYLKEVVAEAFAQAFSESPDKTLMAGQDPTFARGIVKEAVKSALGRDITDKEIDQIRRQLTSVTSLTARRNSKFRSTIYGMGPDLQDILSATGMLPGDNNPALPSVPPGDINFRDVNDQLVPFLGKGKDASKLNSVYVQRTRDKSGTVDGYDVIAGGSVVDTFSGGKAPKADALARALEFANAEYGTRYLGGEFGGPKTATGGAGGAGGGSGRPPVGAAPDDPSASGNYGDKAQAGFQGAADMYGFVNTPEGQDAINMVGLAKAVGAWITALEESSAAIQKASFGLSDDIANAKASVQAFNRVINDQATMIANDQLMADPAAMAAAGGAKVSKQKYGNAVDQTILNDPSLAGSQAVNDADKVTIAERRKRAKEAELIARGQQDQIQKSRRSLYPDIFPQTPDAIVTDLEKQFRDINSGIGALGGIQDPTAARGVTVGISKKIREIEKQAADAVISSSSDPTAFARLEVLKQNIKGSRKSLLSAYGAASGVPTPLTPAATVPGAGGPGGIGPGGPVFPGPPGAGGTGPNGGSWFQRWRNANQDTPAGFFASGALSTIKYGLPGMALYGGLDLFKSSLREAQEFQFALTKIENQITATFGGNSADVTKHFSNLILDASKNTGIAADELATMSVQIIGAFQDVPLDFGSKGMMKGRAAIDEQITSASKIATVTGLPLKEINDSLTAASLAFGTSFEKLGNIAVNLEARTGVKASDIIGMVGDIAPAAKEAGYKPDEIASLVAVINQRSGRSPAALAESLGRILPRMTENKADIFALAADNPDAFDKRFLGALTSGNQKGILEGLGRAYVSGNIDKAGRDTITQLLGGNREAQVIIPALTQGADIQKLANQSVDSDGQLQKRFEKIQGSLQNTIERLTASIRVLFINIIESGVGDVLTDIAGAFGLILKALNPIIGAWTSFNDALGGVPTKILAVIGALKALQGLGLAPNLFGGLAKKGGAPIFGPEAIGQAVANLRNPDAASAGASANALRNMGVGGENFGGMYGGFVGGPMAGLVAGAAGTGTIPGVLNPSSGGFIRLDNITSDSVPRSMVPGLGGAIEKVADPFGELGKGKKESKPKSTGIIGDAGGFSDRGGEALPDVTMKDLQGLRALRVDPKAIPGGARVAYVGRPGRYAPMDKSELLSPEQRMLVMQRASAISETGIATPADIAKIMPDALKELGLSKPQIAMSQTLPSVSPEDRAMMLMSGERAYKPISNMQAQLFPEITVPLTMREMVKKLKNADYASSPEQLYKQEVKDIKKEGGDPADVQAALQDAADRLQQRRDERQKALETAAIESDKTTTDKLSKVSLTKTDAEGNTVNRSQSEVDNEALSIINNERANLGKKQIDIDKGFAGEMKTMAAVTRAAHVSVANMTTGIKSAAGAAKSFVGGLLLKKEVFTDAAGNQMTTGYSGILAPLGNMKDEYKDLVSGGMGKPSAFAKAVGGYQLGEFGTSVAVAGISAAAEYFLSEQGKKRNKIIENYRETLRGGSGSDAARFGKDQYLLPGLDANGNPTGQQITKDEFYLQNMNNVTDGNSQFGGLAGVADFVAAKLTGGKTSTEVLREERIRQTAIVAEAGINAMTLTKDTKREGNNEIRNRLKGLDLQGLYGANFKGLGDTKKLGGGGAFLNDLYSGANKAGVSANAITAQLIRLQNAKDPLKQLEKDMNSDNQEKQRAARQVNAYLNTSTEFFTDKYIADLKKNADRNNNIFDNAKDMKTNEAGLQKLAKSYSSGGITAQRYLGASNRATNFAQQSLEYIISQTGKIDQDVADFIANEKKTQDGISKSLYDSQLQKMQYMQTTFNNGPGSNITSINAQNDKLLSGIRDSATGVATDYEYAQKWIENQKTLLVESFSSMSIDQIVASGNITLPREVQTAFIKSSIEDIVGQGAFNAFDNILKLRQITAKASATATATATATPPSVTAPSVPTPPSLFPGVRGADPFGGNLPGFAGPTLPTPVAGGPESPPVGIPPTPPTLPRVNVSGSTGPSSPSTTVPTVPVAGGPESPPAGTIPSTPTVTPPKVKVSGPTGPVATPVAGGPLSPPAGTVPSSPSIPSRINGTNNFLVDLINKTAPRGRGLPGGIPWRTPNGGWGSAVVDYNSYNHLWDTVNPDADVWWNKKDGSTGPNKIKQKFDDYSKIDPALSGPKLRGRSFAGAANSQDKKYKDGEIVSIPLDSSGINRDDLGIYKDLIGSAKYKYNSESGTFSIDKVVGRLPNGTKDITIGKTYLPDTILFGNDPVIKSSKTGPATRPKTNPLARLGYLQPEDGGFRTGEFFGTQRGKNGPQGAIPWRPGYGGLPGGIPWRPGYVPPGSTPYYALPPEGTKRGKASYGDVLKVGGDEQYGPRALGIGSKDGAKFEFRDQFKGFPTDKNYDYKNYTAYLDDKGNVVGWHSFQDNTWIPKDWATNGGITTGTEGTETYKPGRPAPTGPAPTGGRPAGPVAGGPESPPVGIPPATAGPSGKGGLPGGIPWRPGYVPPGSASAPVPGPSGGSGAPALPPGASGATEGVTWKDGNDFVNQWLDSRKTPESKVAFDTKILNEVDALRKRKQEVIDKASQRKGNKSRIDQGMDPILTAGEQALVDQYDSSIGVYTNMLTNGQAIADQQVLALTDQQRKTIQDKTTLENTAYNSKNARARARTNMTGAKAQAQVMLTDQTTTNDLEAFNMVEAAKNEELDAALADRVSVFNRAANKLKIAGQYSGSARERQKSAQAIVNDLKARGAGEAELNAALDDLDNAKKAVKEAIVQEFAITQITAQKLRGTDAVDIAQTNVAIAKVKFDNAEGYDKLIAEGELIDAMRQQRRAEVNRANSYINLDSSVKAKDPLAVAKNNIDIANNELKLAKENNNQEEINNAEAKVNEANRAYQEAINQKRIAGMNYRKAELSAKHDEIGAAKETEKVIKQQIADALALGAPPDSAEIMGLSADLIAAQRSTQDAVNQANYALMDMRKAQLEAVQDAVGVADMDLALLQQQLQDALRLGAPKDSAEVRGLRAQITRAQTAAADTRYNETKDDFMWQYNMEKITRTQLIQYLEGLKTTLIPGTRKFKDLELEIKRLKDDVSGNLQMNIPTAIKLPTLYEVRRLNQSNPENRITAGGNNQYDNRTMAPQITIVNPPSGAAIASEVAKGMTLGTSGFETTQY